MSICYPILGIRNKVAFKGSTYNSNTKDKLIFPKSHQIPSCNLFEGGLSLETYKHDLIIERTFYDVRLLLASKVIGNSI